MDPKAQPEYVKLESEAATLLVEFNHWVEVRDLAQQHLTRISDRRGKILSEQVAVLKRHGVVR